jgi:hypothetical protein
MRLTTLAYQSLEKYAAAAALIPVKRAALKFC